MTLRLSLQLLMSQTMLAIYSQLQTRHANDMALIGNTVRLAARRLQQADMAAKADRWNRMAVEIYRHCTLGAGPGLGADDRDELGLLGCDMANWLSSISDQSIRLAHEQSLGFAASSWQTLPARGRLGRVYQCLAKSRSAHAAR